MTDTIEQLKQVHRTLSAAWSPRGYAELHAINQAIDDIERLRTALGEIASFKRGNLVIMGEASGDRDEMIHIARSALK